MALNLNPGDDTAAGAQQQQAQPSAGDQAEIRRIVDAIESGELGADGRRAFTVRLQERHAEYLEARAEAWGETPEVHLERILREFRAKDDWRLTDTRPTEQGAPAGSGRRR